MNTTLTSAVDGVLATFSHTAFLAALGSIIPAAGLNAQENPDPTQGEVVLDSAPGWHATLVYESPVGIWTLRSYQVIEQYGCPEIIGLDDLGRCTVLVSYSGKWTPNQTVEDHEWLGALCYGDLDPDIPGPEIYTGGKRGNLYQIVAHGATGFSTRMLETLPGRELHTFVIGDLAPWNAGNELLIFTRPGGVYQLETGVDGPGVFEARHVTDLVGRVRDAVILPARAGEAPWIVTATRASEIALIRMRRDGGIDRDVILRRPMGFGRLALRADVSGSPVLYATRDDGVLMRLEQQSNDNWSAEMIYAGPQGLRGVVSGRFDEDPARETVAVFGYSGKVQLLSRGESGKPWEVKTIFTDRDKGHWLTVAELDGRNGTDEIVGSGYGTRIFLLSRPPGFGLTGIATDPDDEPASDRVDHRPVFRTEVRG